MLKIIFIGISGYEYPHTRVRCYHFAEQLNKYNFIDAKVLSFRDHLGSHLSEVEMWSLRDRQKSVLCAKALPKLLFRPKTVFYIQKLHYHSAIPYLLSRMGFNRFIFDYDDYDVDLTVSFNHPPLNRFFFKSADHLEMTQNIIRDAAGCVGASKYLTSFLREYNENVAYISTGVKPEQFQFVDRTQAKRPVTFLWNGVVWGDEVFESLMLALRAFKEISTSEKNIRFKVVGAGQMMDRVDSALDHELKEIKNKVDRVGWVSPGEMPKILAESDVGLLPFHQDTQWIRSKSPTKLFEYMATGLPVVASKVGEVQHVIQPDETGLLTPDYNAFREGMRRLAQDKKLRLQLGENARESVVNRFSIPVLAERLCHFVTRVVSKP